MIGVNIGVSPITPDKQDGFFKYLNLHATIVESVLSRRRPSGWSPRYRRYVYIDTNAGDGSCGQYGHGSPLLFLKAMTEHRLAFDAHFIEREPANVANLQASITQHFGETGAHVHLADNQEAIVPILADVPSDAYGLLYMDPNGLPNTDVLALTAKKARKIDLLVRVPSRVFKRVRKAFNTDRHLTDLFRSIEKEQWLVRAPIPGDRFDWIFLFGTNYTSWREWKTERFHRITSPEGKAILYELDFTASERRAILQPRLEMMEAVVERSGGICELCRDRDASEVHHLHYRPAQDAGKVIHVCHACHCRLEGVAS